MKQNNYLIKDDFVNEEVLDEVVSSVKSYEDVVALCGRIKNPKSLKKQQKERIVKKLIKFSKTYDEILKALVKPTPFCRFCKTKEFEMGLWEHSKRDINEWL